MGRVEKGRNYNPGKSQMGTPQDVILSSDKPLANE